MADMRKKGRRLGVNAGEANGRAKLSAAKAKEIRLLYKTGARQVDIAATFGVTQGLISAVILGKHW